MFVRKQPELAPNLMSGCKLVLILTKSTILDPRHPQIRTATIILTKVYSRMCILSRLWPFLSRTTPNRPQKLFPAVIFAPNLIKSAILSHRHPQIRTVTGIPESWLFWAQNPPGTRLFDRSVSQNRSKTLFPAAKNTPKNHAHPKVFVRNFKIRARIAFIKPHFDV